MKLKSESNTRLRQNLQNLIAVMIGTIKESQTALKSMKHRRSKKSQQNLFARQTIQSDFVWITVYIQVRNHLCIHKHMRIYVQDIRIGTGAFPHNLFIYKCTQREREREPDFEFWSSKLTGGLNRRRPLRSCLSCEKKGEQSVKNSYT